MTAARDIDSVRRNAILSSMAGFPFLATFACSWSLAGVLSFLVPPATIPLVYVFQGVPAMPIAMALERRLGYEPAEDPGPLLPLTLQVLFIQVVAFPAILIVWDLAPHFVPVTMAAIVGSHFLPFQWIYRTRMYGVVGVTIAVGSFVLAITLGEASQHYTGFFVGATMLVGALAARAHARTTWMKKRDGGEIG